MMHMRKVMKLLIMGFSVGMFVETHCVRDDIGSGSMNDMRHAILGGNFSGGGRKGMRTNTEEELTRLQLIEETNWTPLQSYINGFYPDFDHADWLSSIKKLVEDGADINQQGKYGNTPLIEVLLKITRAENELAQTNNSVMYKILDYLIDQGANPNIENLQGLTALDLAVVRAQWYIVLRLLDAGADLNYINAHNQTTLDYLLDNELDMVRDFGFGWSKKEIENRIRHLKDLGAISNRSATRVAVDNVNEAIEHVALGHKLGDWSVQSTPYGDAVAALIDYIG